MAVETTVDANKAFDQIVKLFNDDEDYNRFSFIEFRNKTNSDRKFDLTYYWSYMDKGCDFISTNPFNDDILMPEPDERISTGQSGYYGIHGEFRASGVMAFKLATGGSTFLAQIYFLHPYSHLHHNQIGLRLQSLDDFLSQCPKGSNSTTQQQANYAWDYFWDNYNGIHNGDYSNCGEFRISGNMGTKPRPNQKGDHINTYIVDLTDWVS